MGRRRTLWKCTPTLIVTVALLAFGSCRPSSEPVTLKAVDLGPQVDERERVIDPTRVFDAQSTVYASIATEGSGPGTLNVEWKANGKALGNEVRTIDPKGPANFAFHFVPPDGWPPGRALIVFSLNDGDKHTAAFEVR